MAPGKTWLEVALNGDWTRRRPAAHTRYDGEIVAEGIAAGAGGREGFVYLNPESDVRAGLELARRQRFHPSHAFCEPGFLSPRRRTPPPLSRSAAADLSPDVLARPGFGFPAEPFALAADVTEALSVIVKVAADPMSGLHFARCRRNGTAAVRR
jgi:hypothetical protein